MRLYLSSYGLGNKPEELIKLLNNKSGVLIINNALDSYDEQTRIEQLNKQIDVLKTINIEPEVLDLRNYFNKQNELEEVLSKTDLVWVRGGNAFVLRRAMQQSGFDKILVEQMKKDSFVYAGYSAGSVVVTPSLKGLELVDNPNDVPAGYDPEIIWDGINLVDFSIAPHYKSQHHESSAIDKVVEYFDEHQINYKALSDGQVIIKNGDTIEIID